MFDSLSASGCVDCPTPQFVVIADTGPLETVAGRVDSIEGAGPGYPMLVVAAEFVPGHEGELVWIVSGMFETRASADAWLQRSGALERGFVSRLGPFERRLPSPFVLRVRRDASGYDAAHVRTVHGEVTETPVCTSPAGGAFIRSPDDVYNPIDAALWVRLPCAARPEGAFFRAADTDLGLVTRGEGDDTIEFQHAGGACGATYYTRRVLQRGAPVHASEVSTGSCGDGRHAQDPWHVCPGGSASGCTTRARQLFEDGTDLRRASRVAAHACGLGDSEACVMRWRIELERGAHPADVVSSAVGWCRVEEDAGDPEDGDPILCAGVEALLNDVPAETLRDGGAFGMVARQGCLRGVAGYCDLLDASDLCDRGGCG